MFRKLFVLFYVVCIVTHWNISWGENHDFRFTRWGMTQEEVIASEEKMDPVEKTENMNTEIECSLREENYYVLCLVEYWSREYSHLLDELKKEVKLDAL